MTSPTGSPDDAQQLLAALQDETQTIVCYSRCWTCMFDQHYDPPTPHSWADDEDIAHAKATGQPEPTGNCACRCARPAHDGGPTVQEATNDDRAHWTNKHAGEGS